MTDVRPVEFLWTEVNWDAAVVLWHAGKSAAEIGREIGTTRNSVIGKLHRKGLMRPKVVKGAAAAARAEISKGRPANRMVPVKLSQPMPAVRETAPPPFAGSEPRTLMALRPNDCRFPLWSHRGRRQDQPALFCAAPAPPDQPYCAHHKKICHQPIF